MAQTTRMNLVVVDTRSNMAFPVFGLQWNEAREIVNFQTLEDINGWVGEESWREFTGWHRIQIGL